MWGSAPDRDVGSGGGGAALQHSLSPVLVNDSTHLDVRSVSRRLTTLAFILFPFVPFHLLMCASLCLSYARQQNQSWQAGLRVLLPLTLLPTCKVCSIPLASLRPVSAHASSKWSHMLGNGGGRPQEADSPSRHMSSAAQLMLCC